MFVSESKGWQLDCHGLAYIHHILMKLPVVDESFEDVTGYCATF